ncbi:MAG: Aspartyl/glutamyl-tRNA amidotransferase subunit A [Candidatus Kaiserbacteria bacterium GW2011_GWC2_52_8b]|nr:MAG: Aspartyl/glutamyl-tRNA amidotransferase subunit A [Candidatus Kaiserbacteria bacterium GW2011_GWC2_52_8b]
MALGSSLDQIGQLTHTVADSQILFDAICGHDENDGTSLPDMKKNNAPMKRVIGVPRIFLEKGTDSDILACFEKTLEKLRAKGYTVVDIDLPNLSYSLAVYYIIQPAEASTNLARYDGIRYGLSMQAPSIQEVYSKTRGVGFGPEVRRRIMLGTFVLSSGYADAYYRKARSVRALIRADFTRAFESVDAVVTPTCPSPAFKFGAKSDPLAMYAEDIFSVPANLAGVPALSVPMGTVVSDDSDLPVGFQIIGPHGGEETLFAIGNDVEKFEV